MPASSRTGAAAHALVDRHAAQAAHQTRRRRACSQCPFRRSRSRCCRAPRDAARARRRRAIAASAWSRVIAGSCAKLRVPPRNRNVDEAVHGAAAVLRCRRSRLRVRRRPRALNALTAAPPAIKFATICAVTACGYEADAFGGNAMIAGEDDQRGRCTVGRVLRWIRPI